MVRLLVCLSVFAAGCDYVLALERRPDTLDGELPPWQAPRKLDFGTVRPDDPALSADRLTMYMSWNNDIYRSTRPAIDSIAWSAPVVESALSAVGNDTSPQLGGDDLAMLFGSTRAGGEGMMDIWLARRSAPTAAWDQPMPVSELNSAGAEPSATMDDTETILVLARSLDLHYSRRASKTDPWPDPTPMQLVNAATDDSAPSLSGDGLTLVFQSKRRNNGDFDLYISQRRSVDEDFPDPTAIDDLNTVGADEQEPWLSTDGREIYFVSNREDVAGDLEAVYRSIR